ncbi:MAG: uridine phosphorylase, partial [Pseudomonadota bacterium]
YREFIMGKEYYFNSKYPKHFVNKIVSANKKSGINVVKGRTFGANSFYVEQHRIDGAITLCTEKQKMDWLKKLKKLGVKNIEMETPLMAAMLNHWGFTKFAAVCCIIVNRLKGDQVSCTKKQMEKYCINAEQVLWNYLQRC